MKKILSIVGSVLLTVFLIALFRFTLINDFTVEVYHTPDEITQYSILGGDGRYLALFLLPDNKAYLFYEESEDAYEIAYIDIFTSSVDGGIHGDSFTVDIQYKVVQKVHNIENEVFPKLGKSINTSWYFSKEGLWFEDMYLDSHAVDESLLAVIETLLAD